MLMRSPHPSLLRWALHPEPAGRRRLVAAYLTATAGLVAALIVLGITYLVVRQCQTGGATGFGCMSPFFRGLGVSIIAGLVVTVGASVVVKLGLRFVLGLLAFAAPVLLVTQLLSILGVESRPYALIVLAGVPAAASWISGRMLREPQPSPRSPRPVGARTRRLITRTAAVTRH